MVDSGGGQRGHLPPPPFQHYHLTFPPYHVHLWHLYVGLPPSEWKSLIQSCQYPIMIQSQMKYLQTSVTNKSSFNNNWANDRTSHFQHSQDQQDFQLSPTWFSKWLLLHHTVTDSRNDCMDRNLVKYTPSPRIGQII